MALSPEIKRLLDIGRENLSPSQVNDKEFQKYRNTERAWRNLVNEAKFDIPLVLHNYIDFIKPRNWSVTRFYEFYIKIPNFLPIIVAYQICGNSSWIFFQYELIKGSKIIISKEYFDLARFVLYASNLRMEVEIEEISGKILDNVKMEMTYKPLNKNYVLTEEDFYGPIRP